GLLMADDAKQDVPIPTPDWIRLQGAMREIEEWAIAGNTAAQKYLVHHDSLEWSKLVESDWEIIRVIRAAGKRLTTDEVVKALEAENLAANRSDRAEQLGRLRRYGYLVNDLDRKGYGVADGCPIGPDHISD